MYIRFFGAKKYVINVDTPDGEKQIVLETNSLLITDIVMHIAPFILAWVFYGDYYTSCETSPSLLTTALLIGIYGFTTDMEKKYFLKKRQFAFLVMLCFLVFAIMMLTCKGDYNIF